ncbi:MAG: hypothetical protein ABI678_03010 [Kofleriaceae bacterium]
MQRFLIVLTACSGSSSPPTERPAPPPAADAAIDAAALDAGVPAAVSAAPAWVFRYKTAARTETWTLRHADGAALLVVENAQGTQRYLGTATDGASLVLDVSTGSAKLALDCKHAKRAVSAKCNDTRARPSEVLDCYHPAFQEPMPFGPAPGIEYVVEPGCNGYRQIAP